jgi:hypothetical protein
MTEDEARQVLLLQAHEDTGLPWNAPRPEVRAPLWTADDRAWATRQAVAAVGEQASPDRFAVARAAIALQRLLPKVPAAQRWLEGRWWHPAWAVLAWLAGAALGVVGDQLGAPAHVNLLAPALWGVVAWNGLVYAGLLLPWGGLHTRLARRWAGPGQAAARRATAGVAGLWAQRAAPLNQARVSLLLHGAAAALGLGLVAGLYLRGLVLDYRIGWQSTFLAAEQVQALLGVLLAPALWLNGQTLAEVAPLRLGPGAAATASAAPWIHLFATTVLLAVVLPRLLLAATAAWRVHQGRRHFPLDLDTPYFQALHPLMRPGQTHRLRLLCVVAPGLQPPPLLGRPLADLPAWPAGGEAPTTAGAPWWRSDDGDELWLWAPPPLTWAVDAAAAQHGAGPGARRWPAFSRWGLGSRAHPVEAALRRGVDAVLLLGPPGHALPPQLAALGRPVLVLQDSAQPEPPALPLRALAEQAVPDLRWLRALDQHLGGDPRLQGLLASWQARQVALQAAVVQTLAEALAAWAAAREPVAEGGWFGGPGEDGDAAGARLAAGWQAGWAALAQRLAALPGAQGLPATAAVDATAWAGSAPRAAPPGPADERAGSTAAAAGADDLDATPAAPAPGSPPQPMLRARVKGRTGAVVGGLLSGALTGLKADLLTGGLSMGAGALAGATVGAVGGAGLVKGVNVARGTDHSHAAWPDSALQAFSQEALWLALVQVHDLPPARARALLQPAQQGTVPAEAQAAANALAAVWAQRQPRLDSTAEAARLAALLQPPLGRLWPALLALALAPAAGPASAAQAESAA